MSDGKMFKMGLAPSLTIWANTSKDGRHMYFSLQRSKLNKDTNKYEDDGKVTLFAADVAALAMLAPRLVAEVDAHYANQRGEKAATKSEPVSAPQTAIVDDDDIPF